MTQPNDSSFYVTLDSSKTSEFPDNSAAHFYYRLPETLWLPGKWKVGVASAFLPGAPNPIPHVVTSHTTPKVPPKQDQQQPTKPFAFRSLLHLYRGSNTDILLQQYGKAFKNNLSKDILSKLKKSDLLDVPNGFEFMGKVFRWMEQDLNRQLSTHYSYADAVESWRLTITAEDNYTSWLLRHSDIDPTKQKSVPYFAINFVLAQRMDWIKETAGKVYDVGSNLIMELADNHTSVKLDPATCKNHLFTFTKPIHVTNGLVYLASTFFWRFVNLNEAFDKAIRQPYETPRTESNVFKPWMSNLKLRQTVLGLDLNDSFVDLPVSPHYWKPTTLSVTLLEGVKIVDGVSKGEYNGELEIDMSSLTQNNTYTVALEWYQKDEWLFNRSNFSADGTNYFTTQKHTHEHNKTHLIYYHTLTIQFTKTGPADATLNIKFEIGYPLLAKYPRFIKRQHFFSVVWCGRS